MKTKYKKITKIIAGIFVACVTSFGIATLSITTLKLDKNSKNNLEKYQLNNKNNNLEFLNKNEYNKETYIKGNQSAFWLNVIWASHKEDNKEKDAFYLYGIPDAMNCFKTEDGNQGYKKIDLSNVLQQKTQNEVIQNFSLGDANYYGWQTHASIAFWTKTNDQKYHIYTAGYSRRQLGRQDSDEGYKTFKRIKNPNHKNKGEEYDFDEIQELSLTVDTLTIWTKDSQNNDHIYFGGKNYGQFGDNSKNDANNKLVETTKDIKKSISGQIKDIAFDYNNSGFILTEQNKLFAAGENTHGELGIPIEDDNIKTFKKVNTDILGKENIKQMSTNIHGYQDYDSSEKEVQSLLLVTENNKLWGLGYDGQYKQRGHSLGIEPEDKTNYLTKLTNIPLEKVVKENEKILYAQTCSGYESGYSFLITESTTNNSYKIYMAGYGGKLHSTDSNYKWAYNQEITNQIFGKNGLDVNFNIENLGNAKYKNPVFLSTYNITVMGQIKTDKEKQFQEQSLVLGFRDYYNSWKTKALLDPMIDNNSLKTIESVDENNPSKRSLTYFFDIVLNRSATIDVRKSNEDSKKESKKTNPNLNYDFTPDGKKSKITINNIDPNINKEYNKKPENKFKISLTYNYKDKYGHDKSKTMQTFVNPFKSFKINAKPEIINISNISHKEFSTGFEYDFKVNFKTNNNYLDLEKDVKVTTKGSLASESANAKFHLITEHRQTFWKIEVTNLKKEGTYSIDDLDLIINYKNNKDDSNTNWITEHLKLTNQTKGYNDFMPINFKPFIIIIPPILSPIKIILIGVGIVLFALLSGCLLVGLLRKKDAKAFSKYESKPEVELKN